MPPRTLTTALVGDAPGNVDVIDLDAASTKLEQACPRHAQVVQLRWFAGFDVRETAEVLGVSAATVKGDWRAGRAFLKRWIEPGD